MTRAIIVEDEAVAARRMQRILEARGIEVILQIQSLNELNSYLDSGQQPDLYFMDIHLNDGIVFDALNDRKLETPIIFTTAYDQYAIKAFKQNSIDYLLKPIDEDELGKALVKYRKLSPPVDLSAITALLSSKKNAPSYKERISVRVGDKIRSINMSEVHFFYSADKSNFLYKADGRSYPIEYSIEKISNQLDPDTFFRVNRGHIISITAIKDVIAYSNSRLKVVIIDAPDHEIIVARDRVKAFKEWLG